MEQVAANFKSWAVVELMGHQQAAGFVTEENIAGANMLRVDIPEVKKVRANWDYDANKSVKSEKTIPAYTRYFSSAALYSLTPCSEEIARAAATAYGAEPPMTLALPERLLPASTEAKCGRCDESPCVCGGPEAPPGESDDDDAPGSQIPY